MKKKLTIALFVISFTLIFTLFNYVPDECWLQLTIYSITLITVNVCNGYVQFEPHHKIRGHYRVFKVFAGIHLLTAIWFGHALYYAFLT